MPAKAISVDTTGLSPSETIAAVDVKINLEQSAA
jgi:hypothetical protein